jgi:hypothetical protein
VLNERLAIASRNGVMHGIAPHTHPRHLLSLNVVAKACDLTVAYAPFEQDK